MTTGLLAWPLLFWGTARLVAWRVRTTPTRAGVWLAAAYPWFALVVLGTGQAWRSTGTAASGPDSLIHLAMSEVFIGVLWLVWLGPVLIFVEVLMTIGLEEPNLGWRVARLILIPGASWLACFAGCGRLVMDLIDP